MPVLLDDVKYFKVITETLNITRASEIIGISQPALSYAIKRLENRLGGSLLVRLKNGVQLTKLGEEFKNKSHRLMHEWEQMQNLASTDSGFVQGNYTIAFHPSVALYTLEFFMPQLQSEFPCLNFTLIHGLSREMSEKLISWEADFGVIVNPIRHPDLVITQLINDEVALFHTKGAAKTLIYDKNLIQSQYIIKKMQKKINFNREVSSGSLEVVAKLCSLGLGYAILPSRVASQYPQLDKLKDTDVFNDEICLVYRPEKHKNKVSQKIIQTIKNISLVK